MGAPTGRPASSYLDELIALLDEEAETRHCLRRPALRKAMDDLEVQASLAGASALTISMIRASKTMISVGERMSLPTLQ